MSYTTAASAPNITGMTLVGTDIRPASARRMTTMARPPIPASEEPLWPHDVDAAGELFLTNAVRGIRVVGALGSKQWTRGPVANALRAALGA